MSKLQTTNSISKLSSSYTSRIISQKWCLTKDYIETDGIPYKDLIVTRFNAGLLILCEEHQDMSTGKTTLVPIRRDTLPVVKLD